MSLFASQQQPELHHPFELTRILYQHGLTLRNYQIEQHQHDPSIFDLDKFVGPFYEKEQVKELENQRGWTIKEDPGRGFRRVVPSPIPLDVIEKEVIKNLVENDHIVIACGGGGIAVYYDDNNLLEDLFFL